MSSERNDHGWPPPDDRDSNSNQDDLDGHDQHRPDGDEHAKSHEADIKDAKKVLSRVRREMPYRKALWGFRLYYIGVLSSVGVLLVSCFNASEAPTVIVPIVLPIGVVGYLYGYLQLRLELREFLAASTTRVWHSRRDRKNLWQTAIFRDSFMGRLR